MAYRIRKTDGEILVDLADGIVDKTSASINLIGKNAVNFGTAQNSDLIHMLENFAYPVAPIAPLIGQLWFDTDNQILNVHTSGDIWRKIPSVTFSSSVPDVTVNGSFWFDSTTNQLKISDGSIFNLVGPEAVSGFGKTRAISESIKDISGNSHPVIKLTINSEVIAVVSQDQFDVNYIDAIPGITSVRRGINFTTTAGPGSSGTPILVGTSTKSEGSNALLSEDGSMIFSKTGDLTKSIVQRDSDGSTAVNKLTAAKIYSTDGVISGNWMFDSSVTPKTGALNLGSSDLPWNNIYGNTFHGTSMSFSTVSATAGTIETVNFTNLKDANNHSVNSIDIDSTLSASSDSHLATQKAIKTYVDKAVRDAVDALTNTDTGLQNQLNGLGLPIPPGAVFYHASPIVPVGYLEANGSAVNKDTYYNLYVALGGPLSPYGQTSQTFNLPDLRGMFIRGFDAGRGIDKNPERGFGQEEADTTVFLPHHHIMPGDDQLAFAGHTADWPNRSVGGFGYDAKSGGGGSGQMWLTTGAVNETGQPIPIEYNKEVRPINTALLPIIKY